MESHGPRFFLLQFERARSRIRTLSGMMEPRFQRVGVLPDYQL
jgi:hypothetical protein